MIKEISLQSLPIQIEQGSGAKGAAVHFGEMLNNAINQLNESQVRADMKVEQFLAGEVQDVHQVVLALREAEVTMQLAVEVRNKILEAYQEIARTPL